MQDAKEEVRSRLNIEDVVGEYVQLKRAGRNFKGLSPFSSERTPSFVVSPDKHIWHDFSSGRGGDVFSFVMEMEGLEFREALEQLARKAGVELEMYDNKQSGEIARKKKRLIEANELAARYYQQSLLSNQHALEYVFTNRKLDKKIVQEFKIGYAPNNGEALILFLVKKGFAKTELAEAGLTNRYGGDIFRGRMTVPLMDPSGQVIGFTGRILEDIPNAPKYLNTPQTLIYDKSRHVFGLSQAKEAIRKQDFSVIVEGNMDVISSHQAGVTNVVASAGTALTESHLKALSRLSHSVRLCFDGDKAGIAATERAVPIAQKVGVDLSIISLSHDAKDPDELIQIDPKLWGQACKQSEPVVDWVIEQYAEREDMTTAAGKRRFSDQALTVVSSLTDSVEREHYLQLIAELTSTSLSALETKLANGVDVTPPPKKSRQSTSETSQMVDADAQEYAYQDDLLAALLLSPTAREQLETFSVDVLMGEHRQKLAKWLKAHSKQFDEPPRALQTIDTYVKIVQLKAETRYGSWNDEELSLEVAKLLRLSEVKYKKKTKDQVILALREAESNGDDETASALRTQLLTLIKETA